MAFSLECPRHSEREWSPWKPKTTHRIDRARAEELLATAAQLQAAFWDALSDLEDALDGIEVSGTRDLSETTIDELIEDEADEE